MNSSQEGGSEEILIMFYKRGRLVKYSFLLYLGTTFSDTQNVKTKGFWKTRFYLKSLVNNKKFQNSKINVNVFKLYLFTEYVKKSI